MTIAIEKNPSQLYPADLLSEDSSVSWWVAHTKSRREKTLATFFKNKAISYYLPMIKMRQPNNKRTRYSLMPLFNGYLFFKGGLDERYIAYRSNHIAQVIEVTDQERLCNELKQINHFISINAPLLPYEFLSEGDRVRIKKGPLMGLEGIIDRKKNNHYLVISITSIAQSVAVHIEADMVEAI